MSDRGTPKPLTDAQLLNLRRRVAKAGPHGIDQETAARIFATLDRERVERARLAHQVRVLKNNRQRDAKQTAELHAGLERAMGLIDLPEGHIFDSAEEFLAFVNGVPMRMEIPAPVGQLREFVKDREHLGKTLFTLDELGDYLFGAPGW